MLRTIGRLSVLGLAVALLALPAAGSARKKASPCAKKKAEKKGCVLKRALYGNKTGDPLLSVQTGLIYDPPTKTVLSVAFNESCGAIRILDLNAKAFPKIGSTLKFKNTVALENGSYTASGTVTFSAGSAKVTGKATISPVDQPECVKTWSATIPRAS